MAPSPAPRPCWMDGRATFTMKKSRTNMNAPNISTIRPDHDRPDEAWTALGRTRVAVMLPSLPAPVTGESNALAVARDAVQDQAADRVQVAARTGLAGPPRITQADALMPPAVRLPDIR